MSESEARAKFRAEVRSRAPTTLEESDLERALTSFIDGGRVGRPHVAQCIQLAGQFAEHARAAVPEQTRDAVEPPPLSRSALGEHTGAEWIRILTPRVEQDRAAIWGSTNNPWAAEDWDRGVAWLHDEESLGVEIERREQTEEVAGLWAELRTVVGKLKQTPAGAELTVSRPRWVVRLVGRPAPAAEWKVVTVDAHASPALRRIGRLCKEVQEVTGFRDHDVTAWLMFGVPPAFERARVEFPRWAHTRVPAFIYTADGHEIATSMRVAGKGLSVTFRTPDVTNADLRTIRERVQWMWGTASTEDADDRRFTDTDRMVLRAWRAAGGETGARGAEFWDAVHHQWEELHREDPERLPQPPASGEAVRRYYYRTKQKSDLLEHLPTDMVDTDGEA